MDEHNPPPHPHDNTDSGATEKPGATGSKLLSKSALPSWLTWGLVAIWFYVISRFVDPHILNLGDGPEVMRGLAVMWWVLGGLGICCAIWLAVRAIRHYARRRL